MPPRSVKKVVKKRPKPAQAATAVETPPEDLPAAGVEVEVDASVSSPVDAEEEKVLEPAEAAVGSAACGGADQEEVKGTEMGGTAEGASGGSEVLPAAATATPPEVLPAAGLEVDASVSLHVDAEEEKGLEPAEAAVASVACGGADQEDGVKGTEMGGTAEGASGGSGMDIGECLLGVDEVKVESLGDASGAGADVSGGIKENVPANKEADEMDDPEALGEGEEEDDGMQTEEGKEEDPKEHRPNLFGNEHDADEIGDNNVGDTDDNASDEENEDANPFHEPLLEKTKQKEFEIFVGGLSRKAEEDDLSAVFGPFGEIQSIRLVKNPLTQKSKGFAFIRYANIEHAKKVLTELKDGVEVKGKKVALSASMDNRTLYLGNICKTWTKSQVLGTLTELGLDNVVEVRLLDDPNNEGKNKGYAFLEFNSHYDAMAAFQRLRKPDAVFGSGLSAKVAFEQSRVQFNEEALSLVKTVFIEDIPKSWDEDKVKELCKQYGEIERVWLSQNFPKKRKKHFGFIDFISREGAVACVEGFNNADFGEGEVKVSASLAKSRNKRRLAKRGARGGFIVDETVEATNKAALSKTDAIEVKEKGKAVQNYEGSKGSRPSKFTGKAGGDKSGKASRGKKREGKNMDLDNGRRPKRARNSHSFGRSLPATNYHRHAYAGSSISAHRSSDLEPHAGYLPSRKQGGNPYKSARSRIATYENQPLRSAGYAGAVLRHQSSYPAHSSYGGHQINYSYPVNGPYAHQRHYY